MKTIIAMILLVLILVLLVPIGYFAWRAGQPMELPQFNGLTYYQFLEWRKMAYQDLAEQYQVAHPDEKVKYGMCFGTALAVDHLSRLPHAAFLTLAAIYPNLQKHIDPRTIQRGFIPQDVTWQTFLSAWWHTFEMEVWDGVDHDPHGPIAYCRLQPDIPTPEEFLVMQQERASVP